MKTIIALCCSLVVIATIPSCKDGGTGPHPGLELQFVDERGYQYILHGNALMNGDSTDMIQIPFDSIALNGTKMRMDINSNGALFLKLVSLGNTKLTTSYIEVDIPANADVGTYAWVAPATIIQSGTGAHVHAPFGGYDPFSGNTVITKVYRDRSGSIAGYAGYLNGTLRALTFVPGSTTPTYVNLTLQSCVFDAKLPSFTQ